MTNKETIEKNIGLTFDFVNHLMDHPAIAENLPADFKLKFIEKDFPNLEKKNHLEPDSNVIRKIVLVRNSFEILK